MFTGRLGGWNQLGDELGDELGVLGLLGIDREM
jgi:hypothetical protein